MLGYRLVDAIFFLNINNCNKAFYNINLNVKGCNVHLFLFKRI